MPNENRSQTLACFPCAFSQLICVSGLFILTSAGHGRVIIDWGIPRLASRSTNNHERKLLYKFRANLINSMSPESCRDKFNAWSINDV